MGQCKVIRIEDIAKIKADKAMEEIKEQAESWVAYTVKEVRGGIPFSDADMRINYEAIVKTIAEAPNSIYSASVIEVLNYFGATPDTYDSSLDYLLIRFMISINSQKKEAEKNPLFYDQQERRYA